MTESPRILIVDDDEVHVMVAKRAIARSGLAAEVQAVGSGEEALRALGLVPEAAGPPLPPAVVLLDLHLPDMSGFAVLARVRSDARLATTPVVLVSSSDRPEDVARAYASGANSYLVKRHDRQRAGGYLAEAARYWVTLNVAARARAGSARRAG